MDVENKKESDLDKSVAPLLWSIIVLALVAWGTFTLSSKDSPTVTTTTVTTPEVSPSYVITNGVQQAAPQPHAATLSEIVKEWRPSTAYVECYWDYSGGTKWYYKQSGSGLLVNFDSVPTVVSNRHVVYSSQYGTPQECDVAFPDDKYVFYSIETADVPAHPGLIAGGPMIPDQPANGQILFTSDGSDVAYLSGFKINNLGYNYAPPLSLQERAKGGNFACTSKPNIGDPLAVLGYPVYGSDIASVLSTIEITATEGIISGNDSGYYTTSAKIDHGNSGGLAIDTTNDCYMGIPTQSYTGSIESLGRILPVSYVVK